MKNYATRLLILCASLYLLTLAPVINAAEPPKKRPKIGLVLGGGGAAGIAHVGVLKVLEENNIPIDVIAGTSMGAIVGSLYAAGYSADELDKIVRSLDWADLLQDKSSRDMLSYQLKREDAGFFNTVELGVNRDGLKLPEGLVSGQKLMFELRRLLARVGQVENFDQLPIPFRAVATDIETGEAVVLRQGNLPSAVRASMAIPGLFTPVNIDNRLLVDGFVSNNVPVDVAKQMGADILIVVSIPYFFEKRDTLNSALAVTVQAMQFLTAKNSLPQLKNLTAPNIVIEPGLKEIGALAFDRVAETIPLGEQAARAQLPALQRIAALSPRPNETPRQTTANSLTALKQGIQDGRVTKIVLQNESRLNAAIILDRLDIRAGERITIEKLQRGLDNVHSLGYFDLVDYQLKPVGADAYELHVIARQRSTGDTRVRFGLSLDDNFEGDTSYQIGARYIQKGATDKGTEWRNSVVIGDRIYLETSLLHPLNAQQWSLLEAKAWHDRQDVYAYSGEQRTAEARIAETGAQVDWIADLGQSTEARAGAFYRHLQPSTKTGALRFENDSVTIAGLQLSYSVDTLDDADFPKFGQRLQAEYTHGFEAIGADVEFDRLRLTAERIWTQGANRFTAKGSIASTFDEDTFITEQVTLGGFGNGSGLAPQQLRGNHAALIGGAYMREIADYPRVATVFAGGSLEVGNTWHQADDISWGSLLLSGSLFVGVDSPIGPAFVGIAQTEGYDPRLFMHIGRRF